MSEIVKTIITSLRELLSSAVKIIPGLITALIIILLTRYAAQFVRNMMTKVGDRALRSKDGKIYDNIRFDARNLLPIDRPLVAYINYIEQLEPSEWSTWLPAFDSALTAQPKVNLLWGGVPERSEG